MTVVALGPAVVDLTGIRAGDQNMLSMTVTVGGVPYDLTDKVVTAQARKTANDPVALDAVVAVTAPTAGQFTLRWPGDAVSVLLGSATTWKGVWDVQVQAAGQDALTLLAGKFTAVLDVTRPAP